MTKYEGRNEVAEMLYHRPATGHGIVHNKRNKSFERRI
jgi:hypothetical protein